MTMPDQCQIQTVLLHYSLAISSSNHEEYHLEESGLLHSQVIEIYIRKSDNSTIPGISTGCIWILDKQTRQIYGTMKRSKKSETYYKENNMWEKEKADFQK